MGPRRPSFLVLLGLGLATLLSPPLHAEEGLLNRLLAPGPLIKGHADLESDCLKCHDVGKGVRDSKCMDCHKEVASSVRAKTGFHGRQVKSCAECHVDHKGRDFDTATVVQKGFDHAGKTGFDLTGKHADLACAKCHTEKRGAKSVDPGGIRWLGKVTTSCSTCHAKDDIHFFKGDFAKKDCNTCHGERSWKEGLKFDHERDAHYKLVGKHASVSCQACHSPDKKNRKASIYHWDNLSKSQCLACHQEVHKGHLSARFSGPKCEVCHTQQTWKISSFAHERITDYALVGSHAKLSCVECHTQTAEARSKGKAFYHWKGEGTNCASCHKDPHRENLSPKFRNRCDGCHTLQTWKITNFRHEQVTGYAITGAHAKLQCTECHKQSRSVIGTGGKNYHWAGLGSKCTSCHEDPHRGHVSAKFQGQCQTCHSDQTWKIGKFDHERITRYALKGKHAQLDCTGCHKQSQGVLAKGPEGRKSFHWIGLKTACLDCHKDEHRFGGWRSQRFKSPNTCVECHGETAWKPARFRHTEDTRYAIDGRHLTLKCNDCHIQKDKNKKPIRVTYHWPELKKKNCETCHANPHLNKPGKAFKLKRCDECHLTVSWLTFADGKSFDHRMTRFPLTGRHQELKCKNCHEVKGKQVFHWGTHDQKFCVSCHANVHTNQFSPTFSEKSCAECHDTRSFRARLPFNHEITGYKLNFKHKEIACEKCHVATGQFFTAARSTGTRSRVHRFLFPELGAKSCATCHKDVHRGNFGATCVECHNEQSWKSTRDFHRNFTLTGVHYTLACAECHKNERKLAGLSQQCVVCHQKDDIHNGTLPNCGECHKQQFWENPEFRHSLTLFPLRGVHRTLECNACHSRGIYRGTPHTCFDCHRTDAPLVSSPGVPAHSFPAFTSCADCHNQFQF